MPTLVTLVAGLWWFGARPADHDQGWVTVEQLFSLCGDGDRTVGCVIDGDTVMISNRGRKPRRIRLIGFDTPEIEGACPAERQLALQARSALADWLAQAPFEWNGADAPPYDQYGRELRKVRRKGPDNRPEYLAETMIAAGLAGESGWGADTTDWCDS